MKIILAGGFWYSFGHWPLRQNPTHAIYEQTHDYYPLSTLMLAGIKGYLDYLHSTRSASFEDLSDDGSEFGIKLSYAEQPSRTDWRKLSLGLICGMTM